MINSLMLRPFESMFPTDIFDSFLKTFDESYSNKVSQGFPKYDHYIDSGNMIIEVALAGYSKDQLSVEVNGNNLTISANKLEEGGKNENRVIARRSFTKSFTDPTHTWNLEAASINFKDGLLKVTVPALKLTQPAKKVLEIK